MGIAYQVPGVYFERRPRTPEQIIVRTDVPGFIGFEPRVRNGTTPSTLTGSPPAGHSFQVDISEFQLVINGVQGTVPALRDFRLSASLASVPVADGESIVYAVVAVGPASPFAVVAVTGMAALSNRQAAPSDSDIALALPQSPTGLPPWVRIADVVLRRTAGAIWVTVRPALSITRCDDWRDYVLAFGEPPDDGTLLGPAVRAFFANGGRRCWVATVRRPDVIDQVELPRALDDMVGDPGDSEVVSTGLARLMLIEEVTITDAPDLYSRRVDHQARSVKLPPPGREACFLPCDRVVPGGAVATTHARFPAWAPIFDTAAVFDAQKRLLALCIDARWRMLLLLSVPLTLDTATGAYGPPAGTDAAAWVGRFDHLVKVEGFADTLEMGCAAMYWPWLLYQEEVDGPVLNMPPSSYAAGVIARRDLARGPQISPANETLKQVVGGTIAFGDDVHGRLYCPGPDKNGFAVPAVNVIRKFAGYGIQVWGARTLSTDPWLQFIAVRRTLTAIELRMRAALAMLVFEPNTPMLWLHITQAAFNVLMPIFESGALRGQRPEEAFYVRCDETLNTAETVAAGELFIEVGVAIAAPAEFIVFRVGRREGVIEVVE